MRYLTGFSIVLVVAFLSSCIKHEVIPPPVPRVDLPASFTASINGEGYELIKDYQGYTCKATQAKELLPTPQLSNMIYYSAMQSEEKLDFVQIGVGRLKFNAEYDLDPSLEVFKNYFLDNPVHSTSNGALEGFEVTFRDGTGKIWKSNEDLGEIDNFEFTSLKQESDEFGDYMKFIAKFNAVLMLDVDENHADYGQTMTIANAVFQGYFER